MEKISQLTGVKPTSLPGHTLPKIFSNLRALQLERRRARNFLARYFFRCPRPVCTENLIRVDDVMESPKLAE